MAASKLLCSEPGFVDEVRSPEAELAAAPDRDGGAAAPAARAEGFCPCAPVGIRVAATEPAADLAPVPGSPDGTRPFAAGPGVALKPVDSARGECCPEVECAAWGLLAERPFILDGDAVPAADVRVGELDPVFGAVMALMPCGVDPVVVGAGPVLGTDGVVDPGICGVDADVPAAGVVCPLPGDIAVGVCGEVAWVAAGVVPACMDPDIPCGDRPTWAVPPSPLTLAPACAIEPMPPPTSGAVRFGIFGTAACS